MRLEQLTSPGTIPNSQKLRVELLKAINYVQLEGMKRGHGSTHVATLSASLAAAKAAVDALAYVPVTGVTVAGAGAVAVGATRQLTATPAPAGAADDRAERRLSHRASRRHGRIYFQSGAFPRKERTRAR